MDVDLHHTEIVDPHAAWSVGLEPLCVHQLMTLSSTQQSDKLVVLKKDEVLMKETRRFSTAVLVFLGLVCQGRREE
jgi:hypothetical protein